MPDHPSFARAASAAHGVDPDRVIYQIVPQTPPLEPRELEATGTAIEIVILWGELSVLHVAHLTPPREFYVGEEGPGTDFVIGQTSLGRARLPLVLASEGSFLVVVPRGANAEIDRDGERITLDELAQQNCLRSISDHDGARGFALQRGISARIRVAELTFIVRSVAAAQRFGVVRVVEPSWRRSRWTFASAAVHFCLLGVCYFLPPSSSALSMDRLDTESRLVMYAIESHDNQNEATPHWLEPGATEAGGGERAAGPEGEAGAPNKPRTHQRLAVPGASDTVVTQMTREEALERARSAGIIGSLRVASSSTGPTSPYGAAQAIGADPEAVIGALLGDRVGMSGGMGGIAMRGTGRGGGGDADGTIGTGRLGTRGHGDGPGGDGYGAADGVGRYRQRTERVPRIRSGQPDTMGSLSKEIIRRVIGRHINEVKYCYESQLVSQPDLQGRVSIQFMISPTGAVMNAIVDHSDVGSERVESCIAAAVRRMDFPQPEGGGLVRVTYPFLLSQTGE